MRIFVEVKLRRKCTQPLQRRIAEVVQLDPGTRIDPTNCLVENSEMC
jgi:hypothetical protein